MSSESFTNSKTSILKLMKVDIASTTCNELSNVVFVNGNNHYLTVFERREIE